MLRTNQGHLQKPLFSTIDTLPDPVRKRLGESWADTFYKEVFCRINERDFEVLYSEKASRPNVPVNVLVGLEILKAGNGWTDEEMYDHFCFDVQVRYALGYRNLEEGYFAVKTIYNFRNRLVTHMKETEENLFEACFEQITGEQMVAYGVKGHVQRTDSKQIMSNIAERTRLQLLLEGLHRVHRMLSAEDQVRYGELLAPYIKVKSTKYTYQLKGEKHRPHIEKVGVVMHRLVTELAVDYGQEETYRILKRLFDEHFKTVGIETETGAESEIVPKEGGELTADSLQSVDDLEATYRNKRGNGYKGYVFNVTETANERDTDQAEQDEEQTPLNLITKVQVAPNVTDDATMLDEALPDLVERTDLKQMVADGGYNSADVDNRCAEQEVELHQTAIQGASPDPHKPHLSHFTITDDENGQPHTAICPHDHTVPIETGRKEGRFILRITHETCPLCAAYAEPDKPPEQASCVFYFNRHDLVVARRRQRSNALLADGHNPRAAVESTVREVSCRWNNAKLRVRGLIRVSMTVIAAAAMVNARRIWRANRPQKQAKTATLAKMMLTAPTIRSESGLFTFMRFQAVQDALCLNLLFFVSALFESTHSLVLTVDS